MLLVSTCLILHAFFGKRKFTVLFSQLHRRNERSLLLNRLLSRPSAVVYDSIRWRHLIINTAVAPETLWPFCKSCEGGVGVGEVNMQAEPFDGPEARLNAAADDDTSWWNHSLVFLSRISLPAVPACPWGDLIASSFRSNFFISLVCITLRRRRRPRPLAGSPRRKKVLCPGYDNKVNGS